MPIPLAVAALIAAGISAATSGAKAIAGGIKARRGEKEMEKALEGIKYSSPEEYAEIQSLLGQRTDSVNTRRESAEERVRDTTASSLTGISQLSDSPVAGLTAYSGMKEREKMAIKDIGMEYEEIRDQAVMGEVGGLQMGADYSDKESYYNDMYKKMVRANMGANKMAGGTNQMWQGIEGVGSAAMDYAGTRYLGNAMNPTAGITPSGAGVQPTPGAGGGGFDFGGGGTSESYTPYGGTTTTRKI